jgi:cyclophilin family peptidyl-prolyl cis-trans isomerase
LVKWEAWYVPGAMVLCIEAYSIAQCLISNPWSRAVVFGKVTDGLDLVKQVGNMGSEVGRPSAEVGASRADEGHVDYAL